MYYKLRCLTLLTCAYDWCALCISYIIAHNPVLATEVFFILYSAPVLYSTIMCVYYLLISVLFVCRHYSLTINSAVAMYSTRSTWIVMYDQVFDQSVSDLSRHAFLIIVFLFFNLRFDALVSA